MCDGHRTTADVLRKRESATDDTLVSYLEEELRKYKGQRLEGHRITTSQLAGWYLIGTNPTAWRDLSQE